MSVFDVILVVSFGLVFSGLTYSLWPMVSGDRASFSLFWCDQTPSPVKALVVVLCAPVLLLQAGYTQMFDSGGVLRWAAAFATAFALCFIQGVVVVVCLGLAG